MSLLPDHLSYFMPEPQLSRLAPLPNVICRPCQEHSVRGRVKCCDYWPFMPNFLLGAGLSDPSSEPSVQAVLQRSDVALMPLGVNVPAAYQSWFENLRQMGQEDRHCPYYLNPSGQCSVWRNRPAECATYFCAFGTPHAQEFWKSLGRKLNQLEYSLAALVMLDLGYLWPEIRTQLDFLGGPHQEGQAMRRLDLKSWAHHQGESRSQFYLHCWEIYMARRELWRGWLEGWFDSSEGLA